MTDKPASPFTGLDKALLRSTQPHVSEEKPQTSVPVLPAEANTEKPRQPSPKSRATSGATKKAVPAETSVREDTPDPIASLQQALKAVGKEIYYIRVTPSEKQRVDDLVHGFKSHGIRTSVNEIGRIALNSLLADYDEKGEQSILCRVLAGKRA